MVPLGASKADVVAEAATVIPSPQQYAWQKMEFNAFIHFGMNTFTGVEWAKKSANPSQFNPTDLNCDQWARTLKNAGVKMAILTAKHEDGFCLWPSRYTKYSVKYSTWEKGKGDVVGSFVKACRKYGLKVGLYLSPWDQHSPVYGTEEYNTYYENQLRELLTNYGPITEIWFDGGIAPGYPKKQVYDWHAYYKIVRRLQPNALIAIMGPDIRWVGTESGVGRTTEWDVLPIDRMTVDLKPINRLAHPIDQIFDPHNYMGDDLGGRQKIYGAKALFWYPAEADVSIRPGWFYHASQDTEVKSVSQLVNIYFSSVGRNDVLLLNVPPNKKGLISKYDAKSLIGLHKVLSKTFGRNYAADAMVDVDGQKKSVSAEVLFGRNKYWIARKGEDTSTIVFTLPHQETFDVAMLQEQILVGQRIERFRIDYRDGKHWHTLRHETTVGYKRLLRFKQVTTDQVRLVIERSRLNPSLSNFGLFELPQKYLNLKGRTG